MSVPDKASYFSRFTVKLVEMIAAGIATAVSGYMVAHLGGYFFSSAPTPPSAQVAPGPAAVSKAVPKSPHGQQAPTVSADAKEQHQAPTQDANPAATPAARTPVNAAQAASPHKHAIADAKAAEAKPRDKEDKESVEEQVRAALANVDASRPAPGDTPQHQADYPSAPAGVAVSQPAEIPLTTGTVALAPRAAELAPPPAQQAPTQPAPLVSVEISTRPVVDVDAAPPAAAPPSQEAQAAPTENKGLLSVIKEIPELLRSNSHAPAGEAPRPPLPVGQ